MNPSQNQAAPASTPPSKPTSSPQDIPQNPVEQEPERAQNVTPFDQQMPQKLHPMVVLQKGERVVAIIKRHPIGIVSLYLAGFIAVALLAALAFFILPSVTTQYNIPNLESFAYVGLGGLLVLMLVILGVATVIYWENQWIVTTDSLTQLTQTSLFNRQVTQLSMDNLEDVSVDQNGIFPHIFNYGTLKVETAGERSKFIIQYCPKPNTYARKILEVHESFLEERRNIQNAAP